MKMIRIAIIALVAFMSSNAIAQQIPYGNLYRNNLYMINPSYAGSSGCTEFHFSHLNQWVKVDGAPLTSFFSGQTSLGRSFGIGGNLLVDKVGMLQQVAGNLSLAYRFTVAQEHQIRIGASAGYFQMRVDPSSAIYFEQGDEIIENGNQNLSTVYTDLGLSYNFKNLDIAFSTKQLLELFTRGNYTNATGYGMRRHMVGYAGYRFGLGQNFGLTPNVLYRGIGNTNQFDFTVEADYSRKIHAGLGFRTDVGIIAKVGGTIRDLFSISYAYEMPMQNIASYGSGSHQVMLGVKLCPREKTQLPPEDLIAHAPIHDTIRIVEERVDTLVIEKIDTVIIEVVSDEEAQVALNLAAESLEFEYDKAIILKKSYGDLEALTNILLIRKDLKVQLDGHTDNAGTEEYNMQLSKDRVEAVKKFLVMNGVDPDRILTYHHGESKPIASNETEDGRARNRRVEMKFIE